MNIVKNKRLFLLVFAVSLSLFGAAQFFCTAANAQARRQQDEPYLKFLDKRIVELGDIVRGQTISFTVRFTNGGGGILEIKDVGQSCNCTAVEIEHKALRNGQIGEVKVSVDTEEKSGQNAIFVQMTTNSPRQLSIIKATFNVVPPKR